MRFLAPRWGIALLCPLLAAAWYLTRQPTTVALFSYPLSPQDTTEVRARLDQLGFDYHCQQGRFLVRADQLDEARAHLARFHLPRHRLITRDSEPRQHGWDRLNAANGALWNELADDGELIVALRGSPAVDDAWVQRRPKTVEVMLKLQRPLTDEELKQVVDIIQVDEQLEIQDTEGNRLWPR